MLQLLGKIIVSGTIVTKTGMRIGGTSTGLKIGGLDLNVITDPWDRPYIPGSSVKGKLRSLLELKLAQGKPAFYSDGKHACKSIADFNQCPICKIWGTIEDINRNNENQNAPRAASAPVPTLTRLICRDAFLLTHDEKGEELSFWQNIHDNIELKWTEVKMETAIDRIKGAALDKSLRQIERVPAGASFGLQMVYNVFDENDKDLFKNLLVAMELLENDYLGGMGSRGYGQVELTELALFWNSRADYEKGSVALTADRIINAGHTTPSQLVANFTEVKSKLQ